MSTDRDLPRSLRSWLHEDRHEVVEPIVDTVLAQVSSTPQRRSRWTAGKDSLMNRYLKYGLAAAAVVLIAFIGIQVLGGPNVLGPGPVETPTQTPRPSLTATPGPSEAAFPGEGLLGAGRHPMIRSGVQLSIAVPASGWSSDGSFWIGKTGTTAGGAELIFWTDSPDNVFSDPCAGTHLSPPAGTSAADLAAAVAAVPGTDLVSGPTEVTIGGHSAQLVVLGIPEDLPCPAADNFFLWYDESIGGRTPSQEGSTMRTWIIEADGALVWIDGETFKNSDSEVEQEMQDIVDSIAFE